MREMCKTRSQKCLGRGVKFFLDPIGVKPHAPSQIMFDVNDGICLAAGAGALAAIMYMQAPHVRHHVKSSHSSCHSARVSQPISARVATTAEASSDAGPPLEAISGGEENLTLNLPTKKGSIAALHETATMASQLGATSLNHLMKQNKCNKKAQNPGSIMTFNAPEFLDGTEDVACEEEAPVDIDTIFANA